MNDHRVARRRMVAEQLRAAGLSDQRVLGAMQEVPRHRFVPRLLRHRAYQPCALPIGYGQTISQPFTVALMTALLDLRGDETVLEIGTGSGYQAAVLSRLARRVVTVDRIAPLCRRAVAILAELGCDNVEVLAADGSVALAGRGPFDAIMLTACAERLPAALHQQLAPGGRLVAPIGRGTAQSLYRYRLRDGLPCIERSLPCRFVPLLSGIAVEAAS